MIASFKCKKTEKLYLYSDTTNFNTISKVALRKLDMLDAACILEDLKIPPSNHLEVLKGDRKGQYSIRINKQFRICFIWKNNNAELVEIVDYH